MSAAESSASVKQGYRTIFTNPNARVCYSAVFIEGCCVLGLFPFIASFLFDLGRLFYTMTVSRLLPVIGVNGMIVGDAALVGVQLIAVAMGPE